MEEAVKDARTTRELFVADVRRGKNVVHTCRPPSSWSIVASQVVSMNVAGQRVLPS